MVYLFVMFDGLDFCIIYTNNYINQKTLRFCVKDHKIKLQKYILSAPLIISEASGVFEKYICFNVTKCLFLLYFYSVQEEHWNTYLDNVNWRSRIYKLILIQGLYL